MCAASTSFFWVLATNQPLKAQVNNFAQIDANPQSKIEVLLPVPSSPVPSKKAKSQPVPPPPAETWQSNAALPIGTGLGSVNNVMLSDEATNSLSQLENSFIQLHQNTRAKSQPSRPSVSAAKLVAVIDGENSNPGLGLPQLTQPAQQNSLVVSQSLVQSSQFGSASTQEFTAPSAAPITSPTFNQLLNSPASSGAVAPLPPIIGESQQSQFSSNLATNSTPTFNQLLNSNGGTQASLAGGGTPTFNQLLNTSRVVNQPVANKNVQPTFEQILNAQQNIGQASTPSTPLSYEQILNAAPIGNSSQSVAEAAPPTFNQILNSQGGAFPQPGEPLQREQIQSQARPDRTPRPSTEARPLLNSSALTEPSLRIEGVYVTQKETSARARVAGLYPLTPNVLFGATLDLVSSGSSFTDSRNEGLNINELYFATSLAGLPNLRFVVGQVDLTSYFDRNSFAKDGASQFFNPVFQTNPALAATGIASRPSLLVNWSVTDNIDAKAAVFSSSNSLSNFTLDGFAGEVGIRYGNAIIRGTYATDRDGGNRDSFPEIFRIARGNGQFGVLRDDREEAYGLNAEVYIPNLKLGLFGRYGRYENRDANRSADTYVLGASLLDLFTPDDRLGLAYGQALTSDNLRRSDRPDVLEMYYDFPFLSNLRLGFSVQGRDSFEETVLGIRVKSDFDITPRGRVR
ncbi:MAG: porin [Calothrix sp. C42_A2020_038]|nr:porin [Calothrix sp. C42_A2020_038]